MKILVFQALFTGRVTCFEVDATYPDVPSHEELSGREALVVLERAVDELRAMLGRADARLN